MNFSPHPEIPFPPDCKKVGIASPASPPDPAGFESAAQFFSSAGVTPVTGRYALAGAQDSYFAAETPERLSDLNTLIEDEEIPLILSARGGYGSACLLENLNYEALRKQKKILCGYSDITALHLAMTKYEAGICVSSPMFTGLQEKLSCPSVFKSMKRALTEAWKMRQGLPPSPMGYFTHLTPAFPVSPDSSRQLTGKAAALNLTLFSRLCGTAFLPDFRDWFLIIEEVGEIPRKIDFSFLQLRLSGAFSGCRGIILGDFTDCGGEKELERIFFRLGKETSLPVWKGFPFGHGPRTSSLTWGETVEITPDGKCFLPGAEKWI